MLLADRIVNDRTIEIINDGVEKECTFNRAEIKPTSFRNLQDYISSLDRSAYVWEKMGQSQIKGIMAMMNMQTNLQSEEVPQRASNTTEEINKSE